jgi:hypothetical protein
MVLSQLKVQPQLMKLNQTKLSNLTFDTNKARLI